MRIGCRGTALPTTEPDSSPTSRPGPSATGRYPPRPGLLSARLVRDVGEPGHFVSFAERESLPSVTDWMELPDFAANFGACSALCGQGRGSHYTLTAQVL
jgi:hypothetical protein